MRATERPPCRSRWSGSASPRRASSRAPTRVWALALLGLTDDVALLALRAHDPSRPRPSGPKGKSATKSAPSIARSTAALSRMSPRNSSIRPRSRWRGPAGARSSRLERGDEEPVGAVAGGRERHEIAEAELLAGGEAKHLEQDPDVLDTWASSWLWPIEVFDGFRDEYFKDGKIQIEKKIIKISEEK